MRSAWTDRDADAAVARYADLGRDLALRVYTTRLLGKDPRLVLHGGGNTSVKTEVADLNGDVVEVLCVKGSGWDMGSIEPAGLPAVRLAPLIKLREREVLSDEEMVRLQRANLIDPAAPNPSVEALLHAFIPHKFVDHTHSVASVSIADQPDAEAICRAIYGDRIACVPYILPGFGLAKAAGDAFDAHPRAQGLMLIKHGIFSFGATAREAYERMIEFVTLAEDYIAAKSKPRRAAGSNAALASPSAAECLPLLRRALGDAAGGRWPGRWVLDLRRGDDIDAFVGGEGLRSYASRGPVTPDHIIRTKAKPLFLDAPKAGALEAWASAATQAARDYVLEYQDYFSRQNARVGGTKKPLDPLPRVAILPGLGIVGIGKDKAEAKVAGDLIEAWVRSILDAEAIGRYEPIGEADQFDMEYWSLEQAKLGKSAEKRLARHVVVVTGGAGAIGAATAKAFAAEGADVAILDIDEAKATAAAKAVGRNAVGLACDVTDRRSVAACFANIVETFGGVDILVSNAGAAMTGMIADLPDETLRKSFEINFFAHQNVASVGVDVMRRQKLGGALLFNVSKQAVNPGPNFGAYGASKAALLALVRQYALEHGKDGVRANALNPDRIRSGLLTPGMIAERAKSRGVSEAEYMGGNLLGQEVTAEDVAKAFVAMALMERTTGDVMTVDGGNVAAMMR
jgi:rhamnose utilization protein RhaD (predicted bifunctional aldolase and dehydrogenase)/NAD(P)-dependent dehydrogenase (short-subunit alcohol dehydrogenase family)